MREERYSTLKGAELYDAVYGDVKAGTADLLASRYPEYEQAGLTDYETCPPSYGGSDSPVQDELLHSAFTKIGFQLPAQTSQYTTVIPKRAFTDSELFKLSSMNVAALSEEIPSSLPESTTDKSLADARKATLDARATDICKALWSLVTEIKECRAVVKVACSQYSTQASVDVLSELQCQAESLLGFRGEGTLQNTLQTQPKPEAVEKMTSTFVWIFNGDFQKVKSRAQTILAASRDAWASFAPDIVRIVEDRFPEHERLSIRRAWTSKPSGQNAGNLVKVCVDYYTLDVDHMNRKVTSPEQGSIVIRIGAPSHGWGWNATSGKRCLDPLPALPSAEDDGTRWWKFLNGPVTSDGQYSRTIYLAQEAESAYNSAPPDIRCDQVTFAHGDDGNITEGYGTYGT